MLIEELARLVSKMREKQLELHERPSNTVRGECRDMERRVDRAVKEVLQPPAASLYDGDS